MTNARAGGLARRRRGGGGGGGVIEKRVMVIWNPSSHGDSRITYVCMRNHRTSSQSLSQYREYRCDVIIRAAMSEHHLEARLYFRRVCQPRALQCGFSLARVKRPPSTCIWAGVVSYPASAGTFHPQLLPTATSHWSRVLSSGTEWLARG